MKKRMVKVIAMLTLAVLLGACRTAAVYNVQDSSIQTADNAHSLDDVGNAIIRAGNVLGWRMRKQEDGRIEATLNLRDHMAKTEIVYDLSTFDIVYKDSRNLRYSDGTIHSNYNGWIQNLETGIHNQINTL